MMEYEIIVILVNFNNNEDTVECLKSIMISKTDLPFVIIVDNNSHYKTIEHEVTFYSHLKVIYNKLNQGFGKANNIAIKWAHKNIKFKYIFILNNDTIIEEKTIPSLINAFKYSPQIGITTCKTTFNDSRHIVWYGGGIINYYRGWPKIFDYGKVASNEGANTARYVDFVSGCVMMISKEAIEQLKGFDEDFFMYSEDLELSIRATKLGIKMFYIPSTIIFHKVQGSLKNQTKETSGLSYKNPKLPFLWFNMKYNQWIVFYKHLNKIPFLIFNLFYWSEFILQFLIFLLRGRFDIIVPSLKIVKKIISKYINSYPKIIESH